MHLLQRVGTARDDVQRVGERRTLGPKVDLIVVVPALVGSLGAQILCLCGVVWCVTECDYTQIHVHKWEDEDMAANSCFPVAKTRRGNGVQQKDFFDGKPVGLEERKVELLNDLFKSDK